MARTKALDFEAQRERILELAAEAFAATSYPSTSMADLAQACGTSKARLYHYYESKDAILLDLLDRYTARLQQIVAEVGAQTAADKLDDKQTLGLLITLFLVEYESSQTRHVALVNDVKFLQDAPRELILDRQRAIVDAFTRQLRRAYPGRVTARNQSAMAMMVFGMINWTFTWLRPGGKLSYADFAQQVIDVLEQGLGGAPA
ncbi:MAG: TetR/AcrR family transcriptional regulator [Candidatus Protistobacter heckmanni]|nr:TetR/AcrR family transcriptional regulator [Candidatus Protistobacter heckmanni]